MISNLDEQKINQQKTSTLRIHQEKNLLLEKYKPKFNSFKSDKKVNKSNLGNRAREYYTNMIKSSKKNGWTSNKKVDTKNKTNNSLNKNISNASKEKNINKYYYSSENMKIKNQKKSQDNFGRNFNNKIKYKNYLNKSNYVIKVKTKMNQNEKNINNININGNKKELATNLILESIQNVNFDKNNLSDIFKNSKNHRRHCSNIISRKYIENHIESQKEQKIILEKINFIQLWWKTIFQIIKIQKNVRGFLYRQRLIEELDREEIVVDNLLFLIKSYKKIVFNIFIFKLWNYNSSIRYCFLKWNEKINKRIIIQNLLKMYGKQISHNNFNNTSSEFIKFDYDCDKNIFRDSTNSLMNNIEILNDKNLSGNIKDINVFENYLRPSVNARDSLKFNNETNEKQLESGCYDKINNNLNRKKKNNKSKNKKLKKNEVQKEKENTNYNNININLKNKNVKQKMENDYNKNYHLIVSKPSVLPNNIKIRKKNSNNNILNCNGNKSELKTKIKRNKMTNKLISKEIIPFSMINNNENISNLTKINPLCNSSNNIILLNKKNKIYENHLYENKKKENKNKNKITDDNNIIKIKKNNNIKTNKVVKKKISEPRKFQEENNISSTNNTQLSHLKNNSNLNDNQNISEKIHKVNNPLPVSCFQNKSEISNNKNNNSSMSIESSFLNSIKSNIKQIEPYKISKYFNFWHKISFHSIIKNRLRSISLFFKAINKIQKGQIIIFFENYKLYYNYVLFIRIKNLFNKYRIKIVKKAIIKCYLYKIFNKYNEVVNKKMIVKKLKEYCIESRKKMIREVHNEIKEKNNIKFERKKNIINKNDLISHANQKNNKLMLDTTNINNSMLNSVNLEDHINKIIKYNYTANGSQPNQSVNQIKKTLNIDLNNNNDDKDIVSQINQLTMVINLIEHLRLKKIKNKSNSLNLFKYFKKWKKFGKNGIIFRDNDNFKSEYELYSKSEHMSISSNSTSKYIPVRGLKYFQGKIKPKNIQRKYKISNLIEKYKTTTIATTTDYSTQTYKKNEINENKLNLNNGSFKTFNDFNSLECNNNNNINQNETQIQQKQNWVYQKKTLGTSLKNNFNKNLNNTSSTFNKINNYQYANDSCFTSLDNYSSNFLNILNNANFGFNDCKIVPLILLDNGNDNETINNLNLDNDFNNKINESFDIRNIHNKYGFQKTNKIEEKEICFFSNKNNDKNLLNINNKYKSNYGEDIGIFSEIKKYYDEDIFISDKDKQIKKCNSFIFNTFYNTIIITQEVKNKRSKSK